MTTRALWLLLLLITCLEAKDDTYLGLGPYFQTQPYKDADPVVLGTPVIFFDNSFFYVRWTRLGIYFYGAKRDEYSWGLSFTAQPQPLGDYKHRAPTQLNSPPKPLILSGLSPRESGWEGGVSAAAKMQNWFAEFVALHDITAHSNGTKLRLEMGRSLSAGNWYFVPSIMALWLSQPFTAYYYGVTQNEADATLRRAVYRPDASLNFAVQTYIKYAVTSRWHLLGNFRIDRLGRSIVDSPLVEERHLYSGMLSVLYSFNLFGAQKARHNPPGKP